MSSVGDAEKLYQGKHQEYLFRYGNSDNITDFVVPYKGMDIDFDNVENWESLLTLLLLDGYRLKLDKYIIDLNDPVQISKNFNKLLD